jgi:hypothetical protein
VSRERESSLADPHGGPAATVFLLLKTKPELFGQVLMLQKKIYFYFFKELIINLRCTSCKMLWNFHPSTHLLYH